MVLVGEASLHRCPEPCLQREVVPMQGAGRSKPCSPLPLSEAQTGNFTYGNCQGFLRAALGNLTCSGQGQAKEPEHFPSYLE